MDALSLTLDPAAHAWLRDPALRRLFDVLAAAGAEARAVGGAVRDSLAGRAVSEVDLAVNRPPDEVAAILAKAGIRTVPTGIAHGTLTAVIDHRGFELTSLRRDVETDGRHATVAYTDDWRQDAARRDFTFNALYADLNGAVVDYFGGAADLSGGRVRFIGDAAARIREDVLRILRFFRFYAWFGVGEVDAEGLRACGELASLIPKLSVERVWRELTKLLAAPHPLPALTLMQACGVLAFVLPEAAGFERLQALLAAESHHGFAAASLTRLAALLPPEVPVAEAVTRRLKLSGREGTGLASLAQLPGILRDALASRALRRLLYRHGAAAVESALPLVAADDLAAQIEPARAVIGAWDKAVFPLQGADLLKLGLTPGPEIGTLLKTVEEWWMEGDMRAGKSACVAEARRLGNICR